MISRLTPQLERAAWIGRVHYQAHRKNTNELVKFSMAPTNFNSSNGRSAASERERGWETEGEKEKGGRRRGKKWGERNVHTPVAREFQSRWEVPEIKPRSFRLSCKYLVCFCFFKNTGKTASLRACNAIMWINILSCTLRLSRWLVHLTWTLGHPLPAK